MPLRIQRKRTKGWRMPENTVYVGRPTLYGNGYAVGSRYYLPAPGGVVSDRAEAVRLFRDNTCACESSWKEIVVRELRGKNLACWCPLYQPCHADVLLEIANA